MKRRYRPLHRHLPPLTRGQVLRLLIYLKGLSHARIATRAGINRTSLTNIMNGVSGKGSDATWRELGYQLGIQGERLEEFPREVLHERTGRVSQGASEQAAHRDPASKRR